MSNLLNEILLRLAKVGVATVLGVVIYLILVGPFGATPSVELGVLSWLVGAGLVLLVETSPI